VDGCRDNGSCDCVLVREGDWVVVLEEGQVAEEGSPEELIRHGGNSLPLLLPQGVAKLRCQSRGVCFLPSGGHQAGECVPWRRFS
jgi:hypothetical protein